MTPLSGSPDKLARATAKHLAPYPRLRAVLGLPWREYRLARIFARRKRSEYLLGRLPARIKALESQVRRTESLSGANARPIAYFTASTSGVPFWMLSWLVTSWGLRLAGERITNFVCQGGLSRCVMGTNHLFPESAPPCEQCRRNSSMLFPAESTASFDSMPDSARSLLPSLERMEFHELEAYCCNGIEVGRLCLPSVRWVLRKHSVEGDASAHSLYAHYIASAAGLASSFRQFIDSVRPKAVVVFNGTFYPEAVAREVAISSGIPVITYEVGHRESSAFFSHGVATEYSVEIPTGYEFGIPEQQEFDGYLARRFAGTDCSMGGVKFWPTMSGLDDELVSKAKRFRQVVSVFTNVSFDTSQASANVAFGSMFEWLEETLRLAKDRPDTLFVLRAHPAEARPTKQSKEPVADWLADGGYESMENLHFIPPAHDMSSYDLVRLSKICLVYNSTIGLEATILGVPVICAGRTKYSREGVTYAADTKDEYSRLLAQLLDLDNVEVPQEWQEKARRFLYYLVFKTSLDFSRVIDQAGPGYGYVLRRFRPDELLPDKSEEMRIIHDGVVNGSSFCYT